VNVIGVLTGVAGSLNIAPILHKHLHLQGIYVGSRAMFQNLNRALAQNQLKPVIDSVYPGAQIQEALRHMEGAGHFGKIVVEL